MTRFPFASLAVAMGLSQGEAARLLGLSGSTWKEYRDRGMTERVADRLAVKAGLVPYEVWPEMLDANLDAELEERRRRNREKQRRYRARHPHVREKERQYRRAYYAQSAEYERKRERERYWRKKGAA